MSANLPSQEIESRLKSVRGRIRRSQFNRAAWIILTALLGGLLVIMAADYFFAPLPVAARWVMFGAWLIVLLYAAKAVLAPLFRKISLVQIARWIESRHPEMEERLSTVLELSKNDAGVSPELLEAIGRAAGQDITKVDAQTEVRSAQTRLRWGKPAIALVAILAASLIVWPQEASRLLVRAVAPFSNVGNAGAAKFKITPGNFEAMEGDRVEIDIAYEGSAKNLDFLIGMDGRKEISQPLERIDGKFRYLLDPARESFTYRAQSGREQSDQFTATIWPKPQVVDPRLILDYQAYTGLLKHEGSPSQGIKAVEGTTVTLKGGLNTPVENGWLEVGGNRVAEAKIEMSSMGGRVEFSWKLTADVSGEAVVRFRHKLGRDIEALRFPVEVLRDQNPQVVIVTPSQKELRVRPDEVLPLRYEVTEDFSLAKTAIEVTAGKGKSATLDQTLPFPIKGTQPPVFQGSTSIAIGELRSRFPGANELKLRVTAEDGRPAELTGPGLGHSEWLTLRIDQNAESLARQELRAEHDEARETIEKAIQEARQAKDQMESLREEVKKESMNDNAVKRLEQSTEKLASAEEKVAELAKEMEHSVHAAKADEVKKAAENLQESREKLENSPLQDKQEARENQLTEARQNAEEAIKQLEEVRNQMDRDREKVQDLARMQELAQQQQELARQAQENLDSPPQAPQQQQQQQQNWQNQQQQMAEALKQQVRERPDAKAEALKQQAEQAKAMAQEAREVAEAQKNLQEQAKQAAQPDAAAALKEQLQQALAREQAKIAEEAKEQLAQAQQDRSEMADALPEATTAADAALEQLQNGQPEAAAEAAKDAAQAMKEASGQEPSAEAAKPEAPATGQEQAANEASPQVEAAGEKGNQSPEAKTAEAAQQEAVGELAERQEQVAGAMEALAKGDLPAALQGLQEAQAAEAAALAEEIKETPLVDGSGNMNEAANNAQQGAQQAEAAEKQGESGQQQQAAGQHEQAAQNFQKSAEALERAAQEFENAAQQAAAQQMNPQKAQLPAGELAEAFQQAGEAAQAEGAEAAQAAAEAAAALSQAAQAARQQMQGIPMPGQPGPPGMPGQPGMPSQTPQEGLQARTASPGVPPELAKLGISAADWEKIKATLSSDVGARGADAIPEEYRGLVKGYFESMSKKKD